MAQVIHFMKKFSILLIVLFFTSLQSIAADNTRIVEVLAIEYPPYSGVDEPNYGSVFQLLDEYLEDYPQIQMKPLFLPTARLQQRLSKEGWCMSFYPPSIESDKVWRLTLSDKLIELGLYHRLNDPAANWQSLDELKGKKVALLRKLKGSKFVQPFLQAGLIPIFVSDVEQGIELLNMGRVDVAFGNRELKSHLEYRLLKRLAIRFSDSYIMQIYMGVYINRECWVSDILQQSEN